MTKNYKTPRLNLLRNRLRAQLESEISTRDPILEQSPAFIALRRGRQRNTARDQQELPDSNAL